MANEVKFLCPCCGNLTLDDRPGTFEICPVCYWEDDIIQKNNPEYENGSNEISLIKAQENYKKYGAILPEYVDLVRKAFDNEKPKKS